MGNFLDFNIDKNIIRALDEQKIVEPTDVQQKVIPIVNNGLDVVAKAPTGTGKTLAFVLPIIKKVDREDNSIQAIIVCPTRELVIQICEVFSMVTKYYESFRVAGIYGGQNFQRQLMFLRKKPQVIVGTPGRILDHLDRRTLKLKNVKALVLDEGDEMLDMGFKEDIEKIFKSLSDDVQKLLFSATIPKPIQEIIDKKFNNPKYIETKVDGDEIPQIKQYYAMIKDSQRLGAMLYIKKEQGYKKCIVFCNTKLRAEKLYSALLSKKQNVAMIHGDLKQAERTNIMKRFKMGQIEILVATDVAARGIDVDAIEVIFNFDPPSDSDFYVHRIGRTARANSTGFAYTFIDSSQVSYIQSYQRVTNNSLEYYELPNISDSYTLPKDGSNKLQRQEKLETSTRFFLNVGKKDLLDKDTLIKLVSKKCNVEIYEIVDVKIRDTFSFVELINAKAKNIYNLKGFKLGTREINIQQAKEEVNIKKNIDFKPKPKIKKEKDSKVKKMNKKFAKRGEYQAYKKNK